MKTRHAREVLRQDKALGEDAPAVVVDGVVEEAQELEVAGEEHRTSTSRRLQAQHSDFKHHVLLLILQSTFVFHV